MLKSFCNKKKKCYFFSIIYKPQSICTVNIKLMSQGHIVFLSKLEMLIPNVCNRKLRTSVNPLCYKSNKILENYLKKKNSSEHGKLTKGTELKIINLSKTNEPLNKNTSVCEVVKFYFEAIPMCLCPKSVLSQPRNIWSFIKSPIPRTQSTF